MSIRVYIEGSFVAYNGRELGLVKEIADCSTVRVWYGIGGTSALTSKDDLKVITEEEAIKGDWMNKHSLASLLERKKILDKIESVINISKEEEKLIGDLIDERHISEATYKYIEEVQGK